MPQKGKKSIGSGIYIRTKEMYDTRRGRKFSLEHKEKLSLAHKGKKFTEEHRKKCGQYLRKGKPVGMTGRKHTIETIEKIRLTKLGQPRGGNPNNWKHSEETKKKMSNSAVGKHSGGNNPNWNGGTSFEPYSVDWTETLRRSIRERDKYICKICNQSGNNVHHIDYNKKNCDLNNLITLCISCHSKTTNCRELTYNYQLCQ